MKLPVTFRGLNTELPPDRVKSGTATVSQNVTLEGTSIKGRYGFDEYDANGGGLSAIMSMCVFHTAAGESYLMVKRTDGGLDYKKLYPTPGSWTNIVARWGATGNTHSTTNHGWWFVYQDRVHYVDNVGVTKWHPTTTRKPGGAGAADSWKAGIQSTVAPTLTAAQYGTMEGFYRVATVKKHSVTEDLSCIQDLQDGPVETRASEGNGGLAVGNLTSIKAADTDYEWDTISFYTTTGFTETRFDSTNCVNPSYHLYPSTDVAYDASSASVNKGDHLLDRSRRYKNSGGPPPGSLIGAFNGTQTVYGSTYYSGSLVPGQYAFSLREHPCMVPGDQTYTAGTGAGSFGVAGSDSKTLPAEPWNGFANASIAGQHTGVGYVGDMFVIFTANGAFWLRPRPGTGGQLVAVKAPYSCGCVGTKACVNGSTGVHAIGTGTWTIANSEGLRNVAKYQFTPTIEAATTATVAGFYGYRSEVWVAIPSAGGGAVNRILIFDESRGTLVGMYDPSNLDGAAITAMCELSLPGSTPKMLLGLSDGRILSWPSANYYDTLGENHVVYSTEYECVVGQETRSDMKHMNGCVVRMGNNASGIGLTITGLNTAQNSTSEAESRSITGADERVDVGAHYHGYLEGNIYRVNVQSPSYGSPDWEVIDIVLDMGKDN